jgi:FkbM family methyltransferase
MLTKSTRTIVEGSLPRRHGLTLSILDSLPRRLIERVFFRSSWVSLQLQKATQRLLSGPSNVRVQFTEGFTRGQLFECLTSEKYFLLGSNFERPTQALLQERVKPGDIVYDVGAHAGYMTLLLSMLCGPGGQVFAFEPSPVNFNRLRRNIELNRISNATLLNLAASDKEGSANLIEMGSYSSLLSEGPCADASYSEVKTIRLDDFVLRGGRPAPRFLKIDIEGHAGRCLMGTMALLRETRPIVFCEIHHNEEFKGVREVFDLCSYTMAQMDSARKFPKRFIATPC